MTDTAQLNVYSIFEAVEGEGIHIGTKQVFLRLYQCKVRCKSCDSPETWKKPNRGLGVMGVQEVVDAIQSYGLSMLSITGGDPMLQERGLVELLMKLPHRYQVALEVTGMEEVSPLYGMVNFINADLKTPSSGLPLRRLVDNARSLISIVKNHAQRCQIKAVVANQLDLDFSLTFYDLHSPKNFVITPCWCVGRSKPPVEFFEHIRNSIGSREVRIIFQQHKFLYGPNVTDV